ncbi:hypothetical protein D3C85_1000550 [compost metagenome]
METEFGVWDMAGLTQATRAATVAARRYSARMAFRGPIIIVWQASDSSRVQPAPVTSDQPPAAANAAADRDICHRL